MQMCSIQRFFRVPELIYLAPRIFLFELSYSRVNRTRELTGVADLLTFWTTGDFDYDGDTDLNGLGLWSSTFTGDLGRWSW